MGPTNAFEPSMQYRSAISYLSGTQASLPFRINESLSLLKRASAAEPAELRRVVWDVATLLKGIAERRSGQTSANALPSEPIEFVKQVDEIVQTIRATESGLHVPATLLEALDRAVDRAKSTFWSSYTAFERDAQGGAKLFEPAPLGEHLASFAVWFMDALPAVMLGIPDDDEAAAAALVQERVKFLLSKLDAAAKEVGLDERFEQDARVFVLKHWPWADES